MIHCLPLLFVSTAVGPYKTTHTTVTNPGQDTTNQNVDVVWPLAPNGTVFPLIAYAHGFDDVGYVDYSKLFNDMASWGFVIVTPQACTFGCHDCKSEPLDPPCFGHYYKQQLEAITWATSAPQLATYPINATCGVGVAGHSMGGQSTVFSAAYNASDYNIKAAATHHAFTHKFPPIATIPFLVFTGTMDDVAPPKMAEKIFNAKGAYASRGLVNKKGADHHEPTTHYNPELAYFTAAWFKIHLAKIPEENGVDYRALIYGSDASSICKGGDGSMKECTIDGDTSAVVTKG